MAANHVIKADTLLYLHFAFIGVIGGRCFAFEGTENHNATIVTGYRSKAVSHTMQTVMLQ